MTRTQEIPIPATMIAATSRPVREPDPVPTPVDWDEVEEIRAADTRTTQELPAVA